jgi:MFS family permease
VRPMETRPAPGSLGWNREKAALALLSFATLIVSLGQYMVVVALPDIARGLGYSAQTLQSVISAYAVASAGFLLFGGRAADLLGRRRILASGLALYAAAALAGGLAAGPGMLGRLGDDTGSGSFDELAVFERGAGADEGDEVGCVDGAPAGLGPAPAARTGRCWR